MPGRFRLRVLKEMCKGCSICVRFCPARALEMSSELTRRGYSPPRLKEGAECRGCRSCELMCPDMAIFVEENADRGRRHGRARA